MLNIKSNSRSTKTDFKASTHSARISNDIVIAYVHELSGFAGKTIPYQMHLGASGVVIRFDGLFDKYLLAHEVGHVLGAGHSSIGGYYPELTATMFYALSFDTSQSNWCTVMTHDRICNKVPYFSNPRIVIDALNAKRGELKPPERLGTDLHDNARWIRENRYLLSSVGNETMACPHDGFRINNPTVRCIIKNDPKLRCSAYDWAK